MRIVCLTLMFGTLSFAQEREVGGRVTFVAGHTVYSSLGRPSGLADSSVGLIIRGRDTVANVKLLAISSKSSSWTVEYSAKDIEIGDSLFSHVKLIPNKATTSLPYDSTASVLELQLSTKTNPTREESWLDVRGRISLQYSGIHFADSDLSSSQPGSTLSLDATAKDIPLRLIVYGNHRQRVEQSLNPWDSKSQPETRIYRLSLEYDDGTSAIHLGRIYPMASPTVSTLDGVNFTRRFGDWYLGFASGMEPALKLGDDVGNVQKNVAYVGYRIDNPSFMTSIAYARSTTSSMLVREAISVSLSTYTYDGFSFYGFADFDVRKPSAVSHPYSPSLTTVMVSTSIQVFSWLSLFGGFDGSRPIPSSASLGLIPDSLLDRTMRSGFNTGATVQSGTWTWMLSFSPRMSPATLGEEYAGSMSLGGYDLLSSGFDLRLLGNLNSNSFADYKSYGVQIHTTISESDWTVRLQQQNSRIRQTDDLQKGSILGVDCILPLSSSLALTSTADFWGGAPTKMQFFFLELSWRF